MNHWLKQAETAPIELVEEVARAIHEALRNPDFGKKWEHANQSVKCKKRQAARAAISIMERLKK